MVSERELADLKAKLAERDAESSVDDIVIYRHPAPLVGQEITAGFEFWVPVRFDTDRLPVSLEEYGVGGAADVKLIEIRPAEVFA